MPPRSFPLPLRIGNDICSVARVRDIVGKVNRAGQHNGLHGFLRRVLTDPEQSYFWSRFGPRPQVSTKLDAVAEFLAGRYVTLISVENLSNISTDLQQRKLFVKHVATSKTQQVAFIRS
jgi:hypothetical protein